MSTPPLTPEQPPGGKPGGLQQLWAYLSSWQAPDGGINGPVVHRSDLKRMHAIHDTPWTQHAVIEGLLELYRRSGCEHWLNEAVRLADAQCARLDAAGHFRWAGHEDDRFSSLVHNALADCALLAAADALRDRSDGQRRERYLQTVETNLRDYVIGKLYQPRIGGFVMNPVDYYSGSDRFIANMNSVALEALVKLDMQRGTTRFAELVRRVSETLLYQLCHDGPCRGSFCYSDLDRDVHIPLYTGLTLRGLPAVAQYSGNTDLREAARGALSFLDRALDPDTGLWVHEIRPTRVKRYPIFVAGAGMICNSIFEAATLAGTPFEAEAFGERLLRHQYPNGAIRNFVGYDHPDNGRRHGTGNTCWEDVYPTPNWNAQAFRFFCRVAPLPAPAAPVRLRRYVLPSRRDGYLYLETHRLSFVAARRRRRNTLALYAKPFRFGLALPVNARAAAGSVKRAALFIAGRLREQFLTGAAKLVVLDRPAKFLAPRRSVSARAAATISTEPAPGESILLATNHAFPPQRVGGSGSSMHDLCLALRRRGLHASVYSAWSPVLPGGGRYLTQAVTRQRSLMCDQPFGYPVVRSANPIADVGELVHMVGPRVAIVNAGAPMSLADRFVKLGVPTLVYVRDAKLSSWHPKACEHQLMRYVATSRALAGRFEERFGFRPARIPPLVLPERYAVESSRKTVTFVCPVPAKGMEIAFALAKRRPDIPFLFVEGWPLDLRSQLELKRRVQTLKNVVLRPVTQDMREIYRETKVLLMPSQWFEAWGRVVSEGQISGIPALVSDIGGLPECLGPGGIVVAHDASIDTWQRALSALWDDAETYDRLSAQARQHARRSDFQPDVLLERLLNVIAEIAPARSRLSTALKR